MQEKRKRKELDSQTSTEAAPGKRPSNGTARIPAPATATPKMGASVPAPTSNTAAPARQDPVDAAPTEEEQEEWVSPQIQVNKLDFTQFIPKLQSNSHLLT